MTMTDEELRAQFESNEPDVSPETYVRMQEISDEMIARFGEQGAVGIALCIPMQVAKKILDEHVGSKTCAAVTDVEKAVETFLEAGEPLIISFACLDRHNRERPVH